MTHYSDPRSGWLRERTYKLQQTGMSYADARERAVSEAEAEFGPEENEPDRDND
jgi:hypothetical protein